MNSNFRIFVVGTSLALGARIDASRMQYSVAAEIQSVLMHENVAVASGMMFASSNETATTKNCPWASKLDEKYKNKRVVGSGATACVYLADDPSGKLVALKVGKGGAAESMSAWVEECKSMQLLRVEACKSAKRYGPTLHDLNNQYIPTCIEVGTVQEKGDDVNYYIMHAAGTLALRDIGDKFSVAERKSLFAQFIGGVYALHGLDYSHNDLHGGNIVIDTKSGSPKLALIDFGEISTPLDPTQPSMPPSTTWLMDYKRDGNAVFAWSSYLAGCPAIPEFPVVPGGGEIRARGDEFLECLKEKWGVTEQKALDAFKLIVEKNSRNFPTQGIEALFNTDLVQKNLPKYEALYDWDRTSGCLAWDIKKIIDFGREVKYSLMYKCETVPTWFKVQKQNKRGKVYKIPRKSANCEFQRDACYTLVPNIQWACSAGDIKGSPCDTVSLSRKANMPGKRFDGSCLTKKHEHGYKYAKVYPGYVAPSKKEIEDAQRRRRSFTPLSRTTTTTKLFDPLSLPAECRCGSASYQGRDGCKAHLGRGYGEFCYIAGDSSCPNAKESKKAKKYYRKCDAEVE